MRLLVVAILLHVTPASTHRQKSDCNYGPGCSYPCHCAADDVCDPLTGCQGDCLANEPDYLPSQPGWEGDGCQTGNLAYNKTAWQYGVFDGRVASRAVDGVVDRNASGVAQPGGPGRAWWTVDLGALQTVYSTMIMNTVLDCGGNYLNHIRVYVSNSSIPDNNTVLNSEDDIMHYGVFVPCGEVADTVPHGGDADVQCGQPLVGRYILVYKYDVSGWASDSPGSFTVAEVTVRGHRYIDCASCTSECDSVYGCIPRNCPPGKTQTTLCSADCMDGTFGHNCGESCSGNCANDSACAKTDGTCPGGCELWWADSSCTANIVPPASDVVHTLATHSFTSCNVTLVWDPLENIPTGLESHYGYTIGQQDQRHETIAGDPWTDIAWINYTGTVEKESYTVKGLDYNSWFSFRLQVYRQDQGTVDRSADNGTVDVKTMCVQPTKPMVVSQVFNASLNEAHIEEVYVTWDLVTPNDSGCDYVSSYVVASRLSDNTSDLNERCLSNTTNVFLLLPDESGTYIIRITANNNGGFGSYTEIEVTLVAELYCEECADDDLLVAVIVGWVCFGLSLVVNLLLALRHFCRSNSTNSHKSDIVRNMNAPPPSVAAPDGVHAVPSHLSSAPDGVHASRGIDTIGGHVDASNAVNLAVDNTYEAIVSVIMAPSEYTGLSPKGIMHENLSTNVRN